MRYIDRVGLAVLVCCVGATVQAQQTFYVDDNAPGDPGPGDPTVSDPLENGSAAHPFDAIQEGIDAAANGDTVLVADGTYTGAGNTNLDFGGKAITVRSASGAESCIIDCQGGGYGLYFQSGESAAAVLDGFTITDAGRGIHCVNGSPTIKNCTISNSAWGGGMENGAGSPTLINCTFSGNTSGDDGGGGMASYGGHAELIQCFFDQNSVTWSEGNGGGMYVRGGSATLTDCVFTQNSTQGYFGDGGGLCVHDASATVINCIFYSNAVSCVPGCWGDGGIISNLSGNVVMSNCTFCDNYAPGCGGVSSWGSSSITDGILWGNTGEYTTGEPAQMWGNITVNYCCVEGWTGGFGGAGNMGDDPLFVSGPDGEFYLSQTAAGQAADSPCVDTGSDSAQNLGLDSRTTRTDTVPDAGVVDMGYHWEGMVLGACCFEDGTCTETGEEDCFASGGIEWLADLDCDPNPCEQPGACCYSDGTCELLLEQECSSNGGAWQGGGTPCDPNPCPQAGACCYWGGAALLDRKRMPGQWRRVAWRRNRLRPKSVRTMDDGCVLLSRRHVPDSHLGRVHGRRRPVVE